MLKDGNLTHLSNAYSDPLTPSNALTMLVSSYSPMFKAHGASPASWRVDPLSPPLLASFIYNDVLFDLVRV